jgi:hypothetical protein
MPDKSRFIERGISRPFSLPDGSIRKQENIMFHLNLSTLGALVLSFVAAPAAQWIGAQRTKALAAASHLEAQAAAIKNPIERNLAMTGVSFAPLALQAAVPTIQNSVNHVISEVAKTSPDGAQLIGTLITAALGTPAATPASTPSSTPAAT